MAELNCIRVNVCDTCINEHGSGACSTPGCAFVLRARPATAGARAVLIDLVDVTKEGKVRGGG